MVSLGIVGVLIGRLVFGKWFNHVSLYAGIWSGTLALFELRLINYYPLELETWIVIVTGSLAFVCGALTVALARWATHKSDVISRDAPTMQGRVPFKREQVLLERVLWVLIIVTLLAALHSWYVLVQRFGSVSNVLVRGALLYSLRVSEGIPGTIPYLSSLCLTATLLAGVYTAKIGRVRLVAILPIVICTLVDFSNMARALMIMAAITYCTGYFMTSKEAVFDPKMRPSFSLQRVVMVVVVIALLGAGVELVRSTRHVNENIAGATRALQRLQGASFITPTIYLYLTAHHGVLNQYMKHDDEKHFFGANTFAPMYRVLAKLGFDTHVKQYQRSYRTPVGTNTGTYLRELHADFGIAGVFFAPFLLGWITSFFWYRFVDTRRYMHLAVLGYLQVLTAMSVFYLATLAGSLLVYLIGSLVVGYLLDSKIRRSSNTPSPLAVSH